MTSFTIEHRTWFAAGSVSNTCQLVVVDGRRFNCTFFREIDGEASRVQLIKMKIYLKVKKRQLDETWQSYKVCRQGQRSPYLSF